MKKKTRTGSRGKKKADMIKPPVIEKNKNLGEKTTGEKMTGKKKKKKSEFVLLRFEKCQEIRRISSGSQEEEGVPSDLLYQRNQWRIKQKRTEGGA